MSADQRGWRIALVPDILINRPGSHLQRRPDVLAVLQATGYGLLQLPPPGEHRLLLAVTADQVAEYRHHGYAILAIGLRGEPDAGLHWRRLAQLLRHRNTPLPPRHVVDPDGDVSAETQQLQRALEAHDIPEAERVHWRV